MIARLVRTALVAAIAPLLVWTCITEAQEGPKTSPIFGVALPEGYRQWQLIAPAREAAPLGELRAVLGNPIAVEAFRRDQSPFPDGSIFVKLAWKEVQSPEFESAPMPGAATTVQVMLKDSKRYAATGGWGFGRFVNDQPASKDQHETCFACHEERVRDRDFVFTRLAQ